MNPGLHLRFVRDRVSQRHTVGLCEGHGKTFLVRIWDCKSLEASDYIINDYVINQYYIGLLAYRPLLKCKQSWSSRGSELSFSVFNTTQLFAQNTTNRSFITE